MEGGGETSAKRVSYSEGPSPERLLHSQLWVLSVSENSSALCTRPLALSRVRPCHIPSYQPVHTHQVHMGTDVLATEIPLHQ